MKKIVFLFLALFIASAVYAKPQEYIRDHTYMADDFDSKYTSRIRAIDGVKQKLIEELGVYIQSVININKDSSGNEMFSHDVVTLTAGIVSTNILKEKWSNPSYYVKASMKADQNEVQQAVKALREDQNLEKALRYSQSELTKARQKINKLGASLRTQKSAESLGKLNQQYIDAAKDLETEYAFQRAMKAKVEGNFEESYAILRKLADKNYGAAQSRLGHMYENGMGREINYKEAVKWYLKSIENGHAAAFARLGFIYERGLGVRVDVNKAVKLYKKGVALNNQHSQSRLGWLYQIGSGVEKNTKKALELYQQSISNGKHGRGFARIGFMYEKGVEVNLDYGQAAIYYQKAIERGNAYGSGRLGWLYVKGFGVEDNYEKAKELALYSARYNNSQGLSVLGHMYERGLGVEEDQDRSFEYFMRGAKLKNRRSLYRIGRKYHKGIGVDQDKYEAMKWYNKAAELGHPKAIRKLEKLRAWDDDF